MEQLRLLIARVSWDSGVGSALALTFFFINTPEASQSPAKDTSFVHFQSPKSLPLIKLVAFIHWQCAAITRALFCLKLHSRIFFNLSMSSLVTLADKSIPAKTRAKADSLLKGGIAAGLGLRLSSMLWALHMIECKSAIVRKDCRSWKRFKRLSL